jgi:hypothetical protein
VAQFLVTGASELVDAAVAVEADYLGRVVEGAEHEGYAPVGPEVGYGLHTAAREVEPRDAVGLEDAERAQATRRDVYARAGVRGGGRHEEHRLRPEPAGQVIGYAIIDLPMPYSSSSVSNTPRE